jgi:hypothetical protein
MFRLPAASLFGTIYEWSPHQGCRFRLATAAIPLLLRDWKLFIFLQSCKI